MDKPLVPSTAVVDYDVMRFDPVASFVREELRRAALEAEDFAEPRDAMGVEFGEFLLGLSEGQVIYEKSGFLTILTGGALEYQSSQGKAFVWVQGSFIYEDEEEGLQHLETALKISLLEPYHPDASDLYTFEAYDDPIGSPRAVIAQEDLNFCTAILNHMKKAYPKPKADIADLVE